jgi:membrane-associated protein
MEFLFDFFEKLNKLDELIRWGGYVVIGCIVFAETGLLIGFFLPGDSLLVTAGLIASTGQLNIWILFFMCWFLAVLGDALGYWIGRNAGPKIFSREKSIFFAKDHLHSAKAFFDKHGNKTIIIARFMPIVRTFAPVVAGVGQMRYSQFFFYNVFGGLIWVGSTLGLGFLLGRTVPDIEEKIHIIILIIIATSLLPAVIEYFRHYWKKNWK